jgi:hypothetical protein
MDFTLCREHLEEIHDYRKVILIDENPLPDPDDRDPPGSSTAVQHLG